MPKKTRRLIAALLLLATSSVTFADTAYTIHNLMPEFLAFWDAHGGKPPEERERLFVELVYEPHRKVFNSFTGFSDKKARMAFLRAVGPHIPEIRQSGERIAPQVEIGVKLFRARFSDFSWKGDIYLIPNGGGFNAGVGKLDGQDVFLIGFDTLAYSGEIDRDMTAIMLHEFFHLYHNQFEGASKQRGKTGLSSFLWSEGLATYATGQIKPDLKREDIFMSEALAKISEEKIAYWAGKLLDHLDATDMRTLRLYLGGSRVERTESDPPARIGYRIIAEAAARLAEERDLTLEELARLDEATVRRELERVLRFIAASKNE